MSIKPAIVDKIKSWSANAVITEAQYLNVEVPASELHQMAAKLKNDVDTMCDYLQNVTGMDYGDTFGVIYHLSSTIYHHVIVLKAKTESKENPTLDSVTDLWETAEFHEREVFDFFGIKFNNHPNMIRLYLRSDWNGYPLRKDYDPASNSLSLESIEDFDRITELADIIEKKRETDTFNNPQEYIVNIGPQHPATHGVMHFRVTLQGEILSRMEVHCGYIHRGIEKMCEAYTYPQILHLTDRLDYLSAHMNRHATAMCVEKALELEIPDRVQYIRTMMDELTRIASHLLGFSAFTMDVGALTAFFYGMRDREKILDIFEETCGGRLITNYNVIGGVMYDIHPDFQRKVKEYIVYQREMLKEYDSLFTGNVIAKGRMIGIGHLSKADAISFGVTGPSGRGSGFACDVRKIAPYAAYDKVQFKEVLRSEGDVYARYLNRLDEIRESLNILEQLVDNIPDGDFQVKTKAIIRLPEGEYYQRVESARGDFGVYINSTGEKSPYRLKFRSPGFSLISAMPKMCIGEKIADFIAIGASLDYVVPDIDK